MKTPRKSTALVSLVLVPLNLLGLGFTGCDNSDDNAPGFSDAAPDAATSAVVDFEDPGDPFNLDPVTPTGGPTTRPTTQPLANSAFAGQPSYHATHPSSYHHGSGFFFLPIPFRSGYQPMYRPRAGYVPSRPGPSVSRSYSSGSSAHSSGVGRGGFGSTGHSMSAGS